MECRVQGDNQVLRRKGREPTWREFIGRDVGGDGRGGPMGTSGGQQLQPLDLHNCPPACDSSRAGDRGRHGISRGLQGQIGESARRVRGSAVEEQILGWGEVHHSGPHPPIKHEVFNGGRRHGGFHQTAEERLQLVVGYLWPSIVEESVGASKIIHVATRINQCFNNRTRLIGSTN